MLKNKKEMREMTYNYHKNALKPLMNEIIRAAEKGAIKITYSVYQIAKITDYEEIPYDFQTILVNYLKDQEFDIFIKADEDGDHDFDEITISWF